MQLAPSFPLEKLDFCHWTTAQSSFRYRGLAPR
jgi:hypothetical protein